MKNTTQRINDKFEQIQKLFGEIQKAKSKEEKLIKILRK